MCVCTCFYIYLDTLTRVNISNEVEFYTPWAPCNVDFCII